MKNDTKVLLEAIQQDEFKDFFYGLNGYQNNDKYNPSPISYKDNLITLYDLYSETKNLNYIKLFESFFKESLTDVEGIFISANYLNILIYHRKNCKCKIDLDFKKLSLELAESVDKNIDVLKSTEEIKRLSIRENIFEKLVALNNSCYNDTGYILFYMPISEIMNTVQRNAVDGKKVPHKVSRPVLYLEDNKLYLAVFVFFYTKEDIETGKISRPTLWLKLNIDSGIIIEKIPTQEKDFSSASYNQKYNIRSDKDYNTSIEYYLKVYKVLDKIRFHYIKTGEILIWEYKRYMDMILMNIPEDYQRFYKDLSITY